MAHVLELLAGSLGISGHLDERLGVSQRWKIVRGFIAILVAFIAVFWPSVKEAVLRAVLAVLGLGGAAWLFNVVFLWIWRDRYLRVTQAQRLLNEAADLLDVPVKPADADTAARWEWAANKVEEFLAVGFQHTIHADYNEFLENARLHKHPDDTDTIEHTIPRGHAAAMYLRKKATKLKFDELESNFLLPQSMTQFVHTDHWPGSRH